LGRSPTGIRATSARQREDCDTGKGTHHLVTVIRYRVRESVEHAVADRRSAMVIPSEARNPQVPGRGLYQVDYDSSLRSE
jgi:hypothetical protein